MKPLPFLLALLLASTTPSRAVVVTLDAVRDNTIFSDTFTQLSNGQGPYFLRAATPMTACAARSSVSI